jgi:hypothetical protein
MLVGEGTDPNNGLPYVDHDTGSGVERRFLTAFPTPEGHAMMAMPGWEEATGIAPIPRSEWPNLVFKHLHSEIPILDQDGEGKCVAASGTSAFMIIRARAGFPFVLLSDDFLYTNINGGRDAGANGGDGCQSMVSDGIPPKSAVPVGTIRPAGYSAAARAAALEYRLRPDGSIPLTTFDEVVTAVVMRYEVYFDVQAGGRYNTNSEGVVNFLGGWTNHQQHAGEGLVRLSDGSFGVWGRNTWGASWGVGGFGIFTERHFTSANSIFALMAAAPDPSGSDNPPVFA